MFVLKNKLLAGSTIVEVVTGVFLISVGMAFTTAIFSETMDYSNLYARHRAVDAVNELIVQQTKASDFISVEKDSADIRIICSLTPFVGHDSLWIVTYSAKLKSSGRILYTRRLIKKVNR